MFYYRRQPDRLDQLFLARRNLFVALADGRTAVLSATKLFIAVYVGTWTEHRNGLAKLACRISSDAFSSHGWNLNAVIDLIEELDMGVRLDLRSLPRDDSGLLAVEEGSDYVTLRDQNGNATLRPVPRFGRDIREGIWAFIADNPEGVTVGQIAKALGKAKSPWLNGKIQSMVTDGYLLKIEVPYRSNMPSYLYYIRDH